MKKEKLFKPMKFILKDLKMVKAVSDKGTDVGFWLINESGKAVIIDICEYPRKPAQIQPATNRTKLTLNPDKLLFLTAIEEEDHGG